MHRDRHMLVWPLALVLVGCATGGERVERMERELARQSELLSRQNELTVEQSSLLLQLLESQQQMTEMLSDVDQTLQRIRSRADDVLREQRAAKGGSEDEPLPTRRVLVDENGKVVVGRNEWAWLDLLGRHLRARIDTGALSASLSAVDLTPFERDGEDWIRFRVPDEEHPDGGEYYETRLVRHVLIRQASAEELERRPVVKLTVRVGELVDDTEFTLTNRENMSFPMLLGRSFLRDIATVDVARKYVQPKYVQVTPAAAPVVVEESAE